MVAVILVQAENGDHLVRINYSGNHYQILFLTGLKGESQKAKELWRFRKRKINGQEVLLGFREIDGCQYFIFKDGTFSLDPPSRQQLLSEISVFVNPNEEAVKSVWEDAGYSYGKEWPKRMR